MRPVAVRDGTLRRRLAFVVTSLLLACGCTTHRVYVRAAPADLNTGVVYSLPRALLRVSWLGNDQRPRIDTMLIPDANAKFSLFIDALNTSDWLESGQSFALDDNGTLRTINSRLRTDRPELNHLDGSAIRSVLVDPGHCIGDAGDCRIDLSICDVRLRIHLALSAVERQRQETRALAASAPAQEGFVYRVPARVPLVLGRVDDSNREQPILSQIVSLPQFGTFALAKVSWKAGSDAVLSAVLGPDGSLREYRVSANTYIDKALGKGFSGLDRLVDIVRELHDLWGSGEPNRRSEHSRPLDGTNTERGNQ